MNQNPLDIRLTTSDINKLRAPFPLFSWSDA